MREFTCAFGEVVDLDSDETYRHLPKTYKELEKLMFSEIGIALVYIKHFHPDWDENQSNRINKLVESFANERGSNYSNVIWLREQVFIFQDEIENMC